MSRFAVCRVENSIPSKFRMECKTTETRGKSGLVDKIRFPFFNVKPDYRFLIYQFIKFTSLVKYKPGFCRTDPIHFADPCKRLLITAGRDLTDQFQVNLYVRCGDFFRDWIFYRSRIFFLFIDLFLCM